VKRFVCMALIIMLMGASAMGEVYLPDFSLTAQTATSVSGAWGDAFLTAWETAKPAPKDIYSHSAADCWGLEGRTQAKKPMADCPICVQETFDAKITAVERGGTVIVRVPESWMENQSGYTQPFFGESSREYTGNQAREWLAMDVHGQAYEAFLTDWENSGEATATGWRAGIQEVKGLKLMNDRHLGNAFYFVLRPEGKVGDTLDVNLGLSRMRAEAEGDVLRMYLDAEWSNEKYPLKLTKNSSSAVFTGEYGNNRLSLYETGLGVYAAVIYKFDADSGDLFYLWLEIEDRKNIVMNGYMHKDKGVYCCVLTEGEAQMIMNGYEVVIENAPEF